MKKILLAVSLSLISYINYAQAPTNGLIVYYPFNGNANDAVGTNNGIVNGATLVTDRKGNSSSAYNFNGTNNYIVVPYSSLFDITGPMTISVWLNFNVISNQELISCTYSRADGWSTDLRNNGSIGFNVLNSFQPNSQSNAVYTNTNTWFHYAVTFDNSIVKFYKDGVFVNSIIRFTGGGLSFNSPMKFGAYGSQPSNWFNGKMDDIRIYNRSLTDTEVQSLYQAENASSCSTCITGITESSFSTNDHFCATQNLCSQNIINKVQTDPKAKIIRGDFAKIDYLGLIGRTAVTNAQNYPVPFLDLQADNATDTTYFKYAKVLSYLEYGDSRSPFDRNRVNFNPSDTITRATVLKVLLETWNIDETTANFGTPMPFIDPSLNSGPNINPLYAYVKKAYELGILNGTYTNSQFKPDIACTREDAFLMLNNLMTNANITKPTLTQINAGLFTPGQYRPDNLGVGVGTDRGNFNHYTKTSFALDGVVPLIFAHSYNSYATELPNQLYPNYLGRGWTHSFNCYIVASPASTNVTARRLVHYPDGKIHSYKENANGTSWICESIGVFDVMTEGVGYIEITTPSKVVYRFESVSGQTDTAIKLVKSIKDRNQNTLIFTNENGIGGIPRVASVDDQAGRSLNFTYLTGQTYNYLSQVTLAGVGAFNGRNIQFTYSSTPWDGDGIKDLTGYKEYDLNGAFKTTSYAYYTTEGSEHLLKTITLPKGNVIDNTYEKRKLRSSQTLNGATVVQQMNTNWQPNYSTTSQSSTGSVSVTAGSVTKTTNYTHNSNGLAQTINSTGTNPVNLSMTYGISADPTSVSQITQTAGSTPTNVNIAYHTIAPYNVSSVTTAGPNGNITQSYVYNAFNDISSFTNGRGFTTTFAYNATGNLTSIIHPIGQPTTMLRNPNGTIQRVTTPAGIVTNFTYNTYGNLLTTSTPNGSNPAITTSATYDALSRVISKTDARNQTVTYDYFANDLLKKMNAPLSYYVEYNYDANDNNTTVTNAKGNATTNVYNTQTDQLMSRSFGTKTESFTYYEDGSLKTFTNGRNQTFTFTYDPSGRITDDSYATYTYKPEGTLNTVTHTQGTKTYTLLYDYDLLRRLNKTTCDGFIVQYRYDNNNNLDLLTYPDGKTIAYAYDNKDRLSTVTDWAGRVTTFIYDDDGKILSYTLPNGSKAIYSYDAAGRPTGISHQKSTNVVICSSSFVLDQGGNHLEENIIEPYTTAPALTAGTTTYTTNARNETTQVGSATNTFDGNGATTNQAGQTITWDTKDNVLTAYGKTFYYDGNETRRAKTGKRYVINELSNSVIAETNDAGTYLYYYVYGPTGLLYRQNASTNAIEYYHYDFRGSTIAVTDASQNTVRQYQYDAYGKILQQSPAVATDDNPFRYVGQQGVQYEEPNLYFMRARYYDPTTGKFLSEDPIWSTNLFAYGGDNPIGNIDPSGLEYTKGQYCTILRILSLEETHGTQIAAFLVTNTFYKISEIFGGKRLGDEFDNAKIETSIGKVDLDWFTDVNALDYFPQFGSFGNEYSMGKYYAAKTLWNWMRKSAGIDNVGKPLEDIGEVNAVNATQKGLRYKDLFTEKVLGENKPKNGDCKCN